MITALFRLINADEYLRKQISPSEAAAANAKRHGLHLCSPQATLDGFALTKVHNWHFRLEAVRSDYTTTNMLRWPKAKPLLLHLLNFHQTWQRTT